MLVFEKGEVGNIRQGYANIGTQALPIADLQRSENGILHGNKHGQHVHAIATKTLTSADSLWISIENWQGEWQVASGKVASACRANSTDTLNEVKAKH
jgi:hypothetical protein